MLGRDRNEKFAPISILLHWLVAVGVIGLIVVGLRFDDMPDGASKNQLITLHANLGAIIFLLGIGRLIWRIKNGLPKAGAKHRRWERTLARIVQIVLLATPLFMPVAGVFFALGKGYEVTIFMIAPIGGKAVANHFLETIGQSLHGIGGSIVMIAMLLHIAGAIKHEVIDRDGTLRRIFGATVARV